MSEVTIDQFVYNPDRGTGRVQIEASRGVFRFVTGSQDKKDYEIATPSGSIHVTGTEFHLLVQSGYIIVALEHGALSITTNRGGVVVLDQPGTFVTVHADGRFDAPIRWTGPITTYAGVPFPYFVSKGSPPVNSFTPFAWAGCCAGAEMGGSVPHLERSWTGFYASLEGGYAWDGTIVYVGPWNKGFGDTGVFGGGNVGYNYQIGSFVLGAQAGYDFANAKGQAYAYPHHVSANIDGFASIDARAGVTLGPALIYGIGGFSTGDIKHTVEPIWSYSSLSYSSWQSGWDIGGGVEWKFTNNISAFAEFRKYDWGHKNFSDPTYPYHGIEQTLDVVRIGLTYCFGSPVFGASD